MTNATPTTIAQLLVEEVEPPPLSLARLTWRSTRFSDEANVAERSPGWQLALASSWESTDRRWRVTGSIQAGLQTAEPPTLWVLLRYRP